MIDLKLLENENESYSQEELLLDIIDIQDDIMSESMLIQSFENLEFIHDQIVKNGLSDTIINMVGDQIQYDSKESLLISIEGVIEDIVKRMILKGASKDSNLTVLWRQKGVLQKTINLLDKYVALARKYGTPESMDQTTLNKLRCCVNVLKNLQIDGLLNDAVNGHEENVNDCIKEINDAIKGIDKSDSNSAIPTTLSSNLLYSTKQTLNKVKTQLDSTVSKTGTGAARIAHNIEDAVKNDSSKKILLGRTLKAIENLIITISKAVLKLILDYRKWKLRNSDNNSDFMSINEIINR